MTTNRLAQTTSSRPAGSAFRALEWAQLALDKGRPATAKLWEEAHKNGWDAGNYCPLAAEKHRHEVRDAQAAWG